MIGLHEHSDVYLAAFERLEKRQGAAPSWLRDLRRNAFQRFLELGFPTSRNEDWRFTNVAPLAKIPFRPAALPASVRAASIDALPFAQLGGPRLVFINGCFSAELSSLAGLPPEVRAMSLAAALEQGLPEVEHHLGRYASFEQHPFVALNSAFFTDGAFISVPNGAVLESAIHVLWVSVPGEAPAVAHPRLLAVTGRESQVRIVEGYVTLGEGVFFTNPVTELVAGENGSLEHYKLQQESDRSFQIGLLHTHQGRSSRLLAHSVTLGGGLVRNDLIAVMGGEGGECTLNGVYVVTGEQHVDNHTTLDHAQAHCSSREYYKGVLDGKASAVFNGGIIVRPDAQKTDAIQSNKNLLLSEDAVINTKPQLQIWADDVRCTHGATIGQLDADAVFYLRSRGIGREEARRLLTYAFANDVLGRMTVEPLRAQLETALFARLSGEQAREAAR